MEQFRVLMIVPLMAIALTGSAYAVVDFLDPLVPMVPAHKVAIRAPVKVLAQTLPASVPAVGVIKIVDLQCVPMIAVATAIALKVVAIAIKDLPVMIVWSHPVRRPVLGTGRVTVPHAAANPDTVEKTAVPKCVRKLAPDTDSALVGSAPASHDFLGRTVVGGSVPPLVGLRAPVTGCAVETAPVSVSPSGLEMIAPM
jgi:hypothetical protein